MAKRLELTQSNVVFHEEDHTYTLDGKELSGITGMLQRQLFPDEFQGIPKKILDAAADYGTSVHKSCEDFDFQWINDGTQEVQDYISLCTENNLTHEMSEYTVSDNEHWASKIDKVYRVNENTFDLADIKTYGIMTDEKLEKVRWQLSIYRYLFLLQNPKAKVDRIFVIHLRNKQKKDGNFDHISNIIFLNPIPSELIKELLDTDLKGEQFDNPYAIPDEIKSEEEHIRELILTKATVEEELNRIKSSILEKMEAGNIKTWLTDTMRLTRKLPTTRSSLNLTLLKEEHPEIDFDSYMKESQVSGSLLIAV